MYKHIEDREYKGFLISTYQNQVNNEFQVYIREGDGFDRIIDDWKPPVFEWEGFKSNAGAMVLAREVIDFKGANSNV